METETQVKKLLSSLIISSPKAMTIRDLNRDYHNEIGKEIPYIKFGFPSIESYLRTIPDVCRINGSGMYALVEPVVNQRTKHINDMILKQKFTKTNKRMPTYRRSRGIMIHQEDEFQTKNILDMNLQSLNISNLSSTQKNTQVNYSENILNHLNKLKKLTNINKTEHIIAVPSTSQTNDKNYMGNNDVNSCKFYHDYDESSDDDFGDFEIFSKDSKVSDDDGWSTDENHFNNLETSAKDTQKKALTSTNIDETFVKTEEKMKVPDYVSKKIRVDIKNNLRVLIGENPDGIWCSQLARIYEDRFKDVLDTYDFGFKSMSEFCENLSDIFHLIRPGKTDWKVFDKRKRKPDPSELEDFVTIIPSVIEENLDNSENDSLQEECTSIIEETNFEENSEKLLNKYPDNIIKPGAVIEAQWLSENEKKNTYIDVIVAEICNPSHFYIQLGSVKDIRDDVIDDLHLFYRMNRNNYLITENLIKVGLYCCAFFKEEFQRAIICRILSDNTYKIFCIDYGTVCIVNSENLYFLHKKFKCLPHQAIQAQLSGIVPKGKEWTKYCGERFLELVKEKILKAYITHIDYLTFTLSLIITDVTLNDVDIHINDVLVDEGFAEINHRLRY